MINLLKRKTGSASREDRLRRQDVQDKIKMHPAHHAACDPAYPVLSLRTKRVKNFFVQFP